MVTQKRDLRTGRTIWQEKRLPSVPAKSLKHDVETDILIIGAGISGGMIAEALAADGHKVMIVDRRGPLKGSTAASTALIQYEIDTPLTKLARSIGMANAIRAWRRSVLAVHSLAAKAQELGGGDEFIPRSSLYLSGDELNADALIKEGQARRLAGIETTILTRAQLKSRFNIKREAALLGYDNRAADPRQLAALFLNEAVRHGADIRAKVEIVDVEAKRSGIRAMTKSGCEIRCKRLVFATGYEVPKGMPPDGHRIVSTYAIATVPQPRKLWPEQCFIWEASDPYLYLRTTRKGAIICGGEDESFSDAEIRDQLLPAKTATLRKKLGKLLPNISTEVEHAWTGSFGTTDTGLPLIGEIPGMANCWAALGYGGNGITYSRIAADLIRAAFSGQEDPDADLYRFR
ncbi:FAD-dependent oxidoreductase [Agaricicola taiwanensis]|uniref:FAD-dependent oxidoreductase n=1 Tax=Agaricicola taiwanensis TaxID=591372 RepID=A0A8J2VVH5_9RHOB|nr:FAD-dependent oxidoreductase [Agaricicola taiwanensis]GGE39025.1 FAD-dependent oxidoreductase [Agaricicola taiwanensis]